MEHVPSILAISYPPRGWVCPHLTPNTVRGACHPPPPPRQEDPAVGVTGAKEAWTPSLSGAPVQQSVCDKCAGYCCAGTVPARWHCLCAATPVSVPQGGLPGGGAVWPGPWRAKESKHDNFSQKKCRRCARRQSKRGGRKVTGHVHRSSHETPRRTGSEGVRLACCTLPPGVFRQNSCVLLSSNKS